MDFGSTPEETLHWRWRLSYGTVCLNRAGLLAHWRKASVNWIVVWIERRQIDFSGSPESVGFCFGKGKALDDWMAWLVWLFVFSLGALISDKLSIHTTMLLIYHNQQQQTWWLPTNNQSIINHLNCNQSMWMNSIKKWMTIISLPSGETTTTGYVYVVV